MRSVPVNEHKMKSGSAIAEVKATSREGVTSRRAALVHAAQLDFVIFNVRKPIKKMNADIAIESPHRAASITSPVN